MTLTQIFVEILLISFFFIIINVIVVSNNNPELFQTLSVVLTHLTLSCSFSLKLLNHSIIAIEHRCTLIGFYATGENESIHRC